MNKTFLRTTFASGSLAVLTFGVLLAQNPSTPGATRAALPTLPAPLGVPKPGPATDAPYAPLPIVQGGVVVPLFPPESPYLKPDRIKEPEQYNMSSSVPGRISSIVNIHNPSIEVHTVDRGLNTGTAIILAAGGGHNTLNVGSESADFVPFFYNYGVNTVILRNRLRRDGYNPQTDEVYDAQQAIRLVRAHAKDWNIDPNKIGIMGFSAGAELAAPAAVYFEDFDKKNSERSPGGYQFATGFRRHYLPRPHTFHPESDSPSDSAQRSTRLPCLRRVRRSGSCHMGHRIFHRHAGTGCSQCRDAYLRPGPPSRRPASRRIQHDGWPHRP
jgi:hypothetical protein